jgi:hypothetical protein
MCSSYQSRVKETACEAWKGMLGRPEVKSITTVIVALRPVSGVPVDAAVVIIAAAVTAALGPVSGVAGDAALVAVVIIAADVTAAARKLVAESIIPI